MNFTFCAFDLGITKKEKEEMLAEILNCPDNFWYYDKFRGCKMLPVFNGGDILNNTSKGRLNFTVAGLKCKTLKDVLTEKVFPLILVLSFSSDGRFQTELRRKKCKNIHKRKLLCNFY